MAKGLPSRRRLQGPVEIVTNTEEEKEDGRAGVVLGNLEGVIRRGEIAGPASSARLNGC